ncbi:MAG: hypothetical protein ACE5E7_02215 [Anaerolineae bacterium]
MSHQPGFPNESQTLGLSSGQVNQLVQDGSLFRILNPSLAQQLEQMITDSHGRNHPLIIKLEGMVFVSLQTLQDERERRRVSHLLQRFQLGDDVVLASLPDPLRRVLQPESSQTVGFMRALVLGGLAAVAFGVLAMAISIQLIAVFELFTGIRTDAFAGMEITAVTFVIFSTAGWLFSTALFWRRMSGRQDQ